MKYNKLVRDNIPAYIRQQGKEPRTHIADEQEYWEKLKEKLTEEVEEFKKDESMEELADVLEVVDAVVLFKQFAETDIQKTKDEKAEQKGRFTERIILDEA